jgi:hypothetical protein
MKCAVNKARIKKYPTQRDGMGSLEYWPGSPCGDFSDKVP